MKSTAEPNPIAPSPGLLVPEVVLISQSPIEAPSSIIYSTNPAFATDANGLSYYIKGGDDVLIVIGEVLGHILAGYLSIPVPDYAVGRFRREGPPYFASKIVEDAIREVEFFLKRGKVVDIRVLTKVILLDIWLGNNDRNIGNLLGRPHLDGADGSIGLVAIDFEKALVVRSRAPLIEIPNLPKRALWPRELLGTICRSLVVLDKESLDACRAISQGQVEAAVKASFAAVKSSDNVRCEETIDTLLKRQSQIQRLAENEWN